jgi:hypothetical protein
MKKQLEQRLASLKAELAAEQNLLAALESKPANVQEALMCLSRAIQILEGMIAEQSDEAIGSPGADPETLSAPNQVTPTESGNG